MVKTIGALISSQRIKLGLTQKAVADYCGVSEGTVSRWESGDIDNMRRDRIASLAQILRISPLLLLGTDEGKVEISVSAEIKNGTPEYDLMQAYLRHPQRVREEIVRRANSIDTTFAQNVSRLLDASGDLNGFKQETNLSNVIIGKLMAGQPVLITPEEAERIAEYFHTDIVDMYFGEVESPRTKTPSKRTELDGVKGILFDELTRVPEDTYTHKFYLALLEYLKNEQTPSYDKTQNAINLINGLDFEKWLTKTLTGVEKKQPHRFSEKNMLDLLVKRLYQNPRMFMITYTKSAYPVKNLVIELIKESEKIGQAAPKGGESRNNMSSTCKKCGGIFHPECDETSCPHCGAPLSEALGWKKEAGSQNVTQETANKKHAYRQNPFGQ